MAAPNAVCQGTNVATAGATWNVNVGSPAAGTLLIVFIRAAAAPGSVTFTGYTPLVNAEASDASDDVTFIYYRWADGTEGATDVWDPTTAVKGAALCWEVSGARNPSSLLPVVSTVAVGTTAADSANPNAATLPLGSQEALFLAMAAGDGEVGAYTGAPSNYVDLTVANSGTGAAAASNCFIGGATRQLTAATDDPGAFTHGAHTTGWTAYTVAIYPAVVTYRSAVAFPVTLTPVVNGTFTSPPETFFGAVVSPYTVGRVSSGIRTALAQTSEAISFERVVNGVRVGVGTVDFPVTLSAVTAGDVEGAGADWFGAVVSPYTFGTQISGRRSVYAHPLLDSVDGQWTTQDGGFLLSDVLDEHVISDADYIRSELHPVDSACRVKLEPLVNPDLDSWHHLHWRIAKDAGAGNTVNMELRLYQDGGNVLGAGTLIASFTRNDVSENFTTYTEVLSVAEAAAITNYATLYLEFEAAVS